MDLDFRERFWIMIYLIVESNNRVLNSEGKILMSIIKNGGQCRSMVSVMSESGLTFPTTKSLIEKLEREGFISVDRRGAQYEVAFKKDFMEKIDLWREEAIDKFKNED